MPSSSFFSGTNPTPTEYENAVDLVAQASAQATAALASQTAAATSAQSAQGYSVSAGTSAETATQQAAAAATSAAGALASQNAAATSATAASSSATSASSSASNAATSATNASNSATSASGSATSAGTYATNAANSATAAANSASDAAATLANALTKSDNLASLSNKSTSRSNLGVAIGSDVQAWDADLDAIAAISSTSGLLKKTAANTWSLDTTSYHSGTLGLSQGGTGATDAAGARTSLGLGTAATAAATSFAQVANNLSDLVSASTARSNLGLGSVATLASSAVLQAANNLSDLGSVSTARTTLGLSTLATTTPGTGVTTALTNATNGASGVVVLDGSGKLPALDGSSLTGLLTTVNNSNWSGTQLAIANGGTGATTASGARTNLGLSTVAATGAYSDLSGTPTLGSLAALSSINNSNWSGTQLSVANGGTGLTSLTAGYIPYGNGTSAFGNSANLTYSGTVLTAVGEIYASQAATNTQQIRLSPQSSGSNIIYSTYAGTNSYLPLVFNVGGSDRLTINTSGNLGLGVTPSAWGTQYKAVQNGQVSLAAAGNYGWYGLLFNAYSDNTNFIYQATNRAGEYRFDVTTGSHIWNIAPSGAAGSAITFTQAMTLDASGNLGVGTTGTTAFKLRVYGGNDNTLSIDNDGSRYTTLVYANNGTLKGNNYWDNTLNTLFFTTTVASSQMVFYTVNTERFRLDANGSVIVGTAAIATNATDGFLYVPTCAGTPTGTPTTYTGRAPIVVNTTNNKLYFYSGGIWRDAGP